MRKATVTLTFTGDIEDDEAAMLNTFDTMSGYSLRMPLEDYARWLRALADGLQRHAAHVEEEIDDRLQ